MEQFTHIASDIMSVARWKYKRCMEQLLKAHHMKGEKSAITYMLGYMDSQELYHISSEGSSLALCL